MKIAFVVMGYLPNDRGGVPIYIDKLRREILQKNIKSIVLCEKRTTNDVSDTDSGVYYINNPLINLIPPFRQFGFLLGLLLSFNIIFREKPTHFHGHTSFYGGYQSILLGLIYKKPIIVTCHGIDKQGRLYFLYKKADCIIYQIESTYKNLLSYKLPRSKLIEVPNCIDISELDLFSQSSNFIYLARFDDMKNPHLVLETARLSKKLQLQVKFTLIGEGRLFDEIKIHSTNNMVLTGKLSKVEDYLKIVRPMGYLAVSKIENYSSTSLLEMINYGIPVIATNVGETTKLITNENGFVCDLTPESVVEQIQLILKHPDIAKSKANKLKQIIVNQYSMTTMIYKHVQIYSILST
ncbi:MAG: hypothetical protein HeimC2_17880 [Candidatus Heimdallarchaeota archaeon LC_2]|nr:MAG: hypothetical protein HeimC2_17880 [Candidatus Heimdallarchaeota archaeon LC_2]